MIVMLINACTAVTVILAVVIQVLNAQQTRTWNHDGSYNKIGAANWGSVSPLCNAMSQSPINVNTTAVVSTSSVELKFSGYDMKSSADFTMDNIGFGVATNLNVNTVSVTKTGTAGKYVLEQFHFHWGTNNTTGSEHSIDGKFYPLVIHFYHYNSDKYSNLFDAIINGSADPAAVLAIAVFVDVKTGSKHSLRAEAALSAIINKLDRVKYQGNSSSIDSFELEKLFPCGSSAVFTYSGSVTIPPCTENINHNVFRQPIYLPADMIAKFRDLYDTDDTEKIKMNYRPVQPLNGRTVNKFSFKNEKCGNGNNGTGKTRRDPVTTLIVAVALTVVCRVFSGLQ